MSMKKTVMLSVLAAALSTSAAVSVSSTVSAAEAKSANVQIQSFTLFVNDESKTVRVINYNGAKLVSVRDVGRAAGAMFGVEANGSINVYFEDRTIQLTDSSNVAIVDGEALQLQSPVVNVKNSFFIELDGFLEALGVEQEIDSQGQVWVDAGKRLLDVENPHWIKGGSLIVSTLTDEGRIDYKLNAATGEFAELFRTEGASDLVIAPGGSKAAYTDESGSIYVLDLESKSSTQVSADSSIKPELVWAADESAIYFLQGDKGSVIAKLDLGERKISKVLEDKVDYKADLAVSADGKQFYYTVIKPGAVTADSNQPVDMDDVTIDMSGTEPQVYTYNSSEKDAKPVKLTSTSDDKVFVGAAADGSKAFFINIEDNKPSSLVSVAKDQSAKTIIGDKDVAQAVMAGDKLFVLAEEGAGQAIYEVDAAAGSVKKLYSVSADVTDVIATSAEQIAIVQDGQVLVNNNGKWKKLTK
ncbi:stalk domain-containing protein [Paenibacillus sp. GCM10027626]|uniref:stalk domain-containing protein n=1 Tax=Paenibacillus sp. GCM10027626 TaxID=3273411 RepID=UPI00363011ED